MSEIFYISAFLFILRTYLKTKLIRDFYYALYFLFLFGPTLPFSWIKVNPNNSELILTLAFISNACLFIAFLFLNAFLDLTTLDRISGYLIIMGVSIGLVIMAIFLGDVARVEWFEKYNVFIPDIKYIGLGQILYIMYFILLLFSLLRFAFLGFRWVNIYEKNTSHDVNYKRKFILYNILGQFGWLFFSTIKKLFFPLLFGFDFLISSIFYVLLCYNYVINHNKFNFFSGSLEHIIVMEQDGAPVMDIDFTSRSPQFIDIETISSTSSYSSMSILAIIQFIQNSLPQNLAGGQKIRHISLDKTEIIIFSTESLFWVLISQGSSRMFEYLLKRLAGRVENEFTEALESMRMGITPSEDFRKEIVNYCINMM